MYENSIAGEFRNYEITAPTSPALVYDLLSQIDKNDYDAILDIGTIVQPLHYPCQNTNVRYKVPVDGAMVSVSGAFSVRSTAAPSGAAEIVSQTVKYDCPLYFWPHKTYVSSVASTKILVKVLFS